jgi:hypothetical protein
LPPAGAAVPFLAGPKMFAGDQGEFDVLGEIGMIQSPTWFSISRKLREEINSKMYSNLRAICIKHS